MNRDSTAAGTAFQSKPCLILSDSIGTDLRYIFKADIVAKRGCTIQGLTEYIDRLDLSVYTCIIVLIGTNDLTNKKIWFEYRKNRNNPKYTLQPHPTTDVDILKSKYIALIDLIKNKNPEIKLEISPIIPRPFDYDINLEYLKEVNNMVKQVCITKQCYHDRTLITSFLKSGKPEEKLFDKDGLHLSTSGNDKLIRIFRLKTAKLISLTKNA